MACYQIEKFAIPEIIWSLFSSADYSQAELIWYKFVCRPSAYVNFFKSLLLLHFKSLLLLHFLLDYFETRYTYFLGQSPNFVLFRILKFGFSDFFLWIFIKFHWNRYCCYNFQWIPLKLCAVIISVSLHIIFFSFFWNLLSFFLNEFSLKSLLLLQFPMDSFETRYTYSLGQSSHLLFRFLKCVFFLGGGRIFIQFSFKLLLLLQYLMDSIEIRYGN